jgi:hypothetical protein
MNDVLPPIRSRLSWLGTSWRSTVLDLDATHVVVQTVQHEAVYADLVRTGLHRPPRWGADHDFAEGYEWMARQMSERLPTDGDGIIWSWAQGRRRDLRPGKADRGRVLLRCRIPRARVLVSHFSDWHCVLNRMPFHAPQRNEDADSYEKRVGPDLDAFFDHVEAKGLLLSPISAWPADLRQEVEASWTGIFDHRYWTERDMLQATMHELRATDVVEAIRFP